MGMSGANQVHYQATTTTTTTDKKKKKDEQEKDTCCVLGAKVWVVLIGILCCLVGLLISASALYAKFGFQGYAALNAALPTGGIWMIFGFGATLALCSIILMLSACCYQHLCFKTILFVFALILTVLLLLEVVSAGIFVWGLGILTLPKTSIGDITADKILAARNATVYKTWEDCCVVNKPPYNILNITGTVDSVCLWPNAADGALKEACGTQDVLVCVCKDPVAYGADFGVFLQSKLTWVAGVTIVLAVLLLFGLIATCVLICAKKKKAEATYTPES